MTHERAKGWKIRRTLSFPGENRQYNEFLKEWDLNGNPHWADHYMDGLIYTSENHAQMAREECRSRNSNLNVIYHAVVEA